MNSDTKFYSYVSSSFSQVADELVAEFTDPNNNIEAPDPDNPNAVRNVPYTWCIYLI